MNRQQATSLTKYHSDTGVLDLHYWPNTGANVAPASSLVTIVCKCSTAGFANCIDGYTDNAPPDTSCCDACRGDCCTYTDSSGVFSDACIGLIGNDTTRMEAAIALEPIRMQISHPW